MVSPPPGPLPADVTAVGQLWSLDVAGLDPRRLEGEGGRRALEGLFRALVERLGLRPVAAPVWHVFPAPHRGVTGMVALSESHLACHSFPEHGGLTLDLYTCRVRPAPDWQALLAQHLGGTPRVDLRVVPRGFGGDRS